MRIFKTLNVKSISKREKFLIILFTCLLIVFFYYSGLFSPLRDKQVLAREEYLSKKQNKDMPHIYTEKEAKNDILTLLTNLQKFGKIISDEETYTISENVVNLVYFLEFEFDANSLIAEKDMMKFFSDIPLSSLKLHYNGKNLEKIDCIMNYSLVDSETVLESDLGVIRDSFEMKESENIESPSFKNDGEGIEKNSDKKQEIKSNKPESKEKIVKPKKNEKSSVNVANEKVDKSNLVEMSKDSNMKETYERVEAISLLPKEFEISYDYQTLNPTIVGTKECFVTLDFIGEEECLEITYFNFSTIAKELLYIEWDGFLLGKDNYIKIEKESLWGDVLALIETNEGAVIEIPMEIGEDDYWYIPKVYLESSSEWKWMGIIYNYHENESVGRIFFFNPVICYEE